MSVYMIVEGVVVAVSISGAPAREHSGNEFWMLAALAHQIALIMVWLGLYALREVLPADTR